MRTLFFQVGRVVRIWNAASLIAGRDDAFDEALRLGDLPGGRLVHLAVEAEDAAVRAQGIAFVGLVKGFHQVAATAARRGCCA